MTSVGKKILFVVAMVAFAIAIWLVAIYGQSSGWFVVWFVIGFAAIIAILVCPERPVPPRWGVRDELNRIAVMICTALIVVLVVVAILVVYLVTYVADSIMALFLPADQSKPAA